MHAYIEALLVTFALLRNESKHKSGTTVKIGMRTGLTEQELSIEKYIEIIGVAHHQVH